MRAMGTRLLAPEQGQSTVEYAAMLTVALIVLAALRVMSTEIAVLYHIVAQTLAP